MTRIKGIVLWFNTQKRYGFVSVNGNEYFVHADEIRNVSTLKEGDVVTFLPSTNPKGQMCKDVKLLYDGE